MKEEPRGRLVVAAPEDAARLADHAIATGRAAELSERVYVLPGAQPGTAYVFDLDALGLEVDDALGRFCL